MYIKAKNMFTIRQTVHKLHCSRKNWQIKVAYHSGYPSSSSRLDDFSTQLNGTKNNKCEKMVLDFYREIKHGAQNPDFTFARDSLIDCDELKDGGGLL